MPSYRRQRASLEVPFPNYAFAPTDCSVACGAGLKSFLKWALPFALPIVAWIAYDGGWLDDLDLWFDEFEVSLPGQSTSPELSIDWSGRGSERQGPVQLTSGDRLDFNLSHQGSGRFVVSALPRTNGPPIELFSASGNFEGSDHKYVGEASDVREGVYEIDVDATGPWSIQIRLARANSGNTVETSPRNAFDAARLIIDWRGEGDDLIGPVDLHDDGSILKFQTTHRGSSRFRVSCYSVDRPTRFCPEIASGFGNTADAIELRVGEVYFGGLFELFDWYAGEYNFRVEADGPWTITAQKISPRPPTAQTDEPGLFLDLQGDGDDIVGPVKLKEGNLIQFDVTHRGTASFELSCYPAKGAAFCPDLVSGRGAFSKSSDQLIVGAPYTLLGLPWRGGDYNFRIKADGPWRIKARLIRPRSPDSSGRPTARVGS